MLEKQNSEWRRQSVTHGSFFLSKYFLFTCMVPTDLDCNMYIYIILNTNLTKTKEFGDYVQVPFRRFTVLFCFNLQQTAN